MLPSSFHTACSLSCPSLSYIKKICEFLIMYTRAPKYIFAPTLQRQNTENWKQIFPEKELSCLSPNFHIHVLYMWAIFIVYSQSAYSATGKYVDGSWEYINRSQKHGCGNWDWGRAIPFLGIHKWDFRCSAIPLNISTVCSLSSVNCLHYTVCTVNKHYMTCRQSIFKIFLCSIAYK